MCSITFAKYILLLLGYFYFSLNIEGKGKRDEHIISQIIFTRCLRLTLRTSKMPKKLVGLAAPHKPRADMLAWLRQPR